MIRGLLTITTALAPTEQISVSMAHNQTETAGKIQDHMKH